MNPMMGRFSTMILRKPVFLVLGSLLNGGPSIGGGQAFAQSTPLPPPITIPATPPTAQSPVGSQTQSPVASQAPSAAAQATSVQPAATPIAIVPTEGLRLTGASEIAEGRAIFGTSGSIAAGDKPALVTLPRRGNLRLCPTTKVELTSDSSLASSGASLRPMEAPGLMMALDQGAMEANFATGHNSDVILTPDFRIVISGPGLAAVQVRLGPRGDTCVDNRGADAPYVTVSSIFSGGVYRVQGDQRVMFQHGSLNEVVDREKESCGCPPDGPPSARGNDFPLAQSAGLAPLPAAAPNAVNKGTVGAQATVQLAYNGDDPNKVKASVESPPNVTPPPAKRKSKPGLFHSIGRFFLRMFGG